MNYFSKNIKILRKSMSYTQGYLADLLGVKANSISNYENGVSEPTIEQIAQFIKIFDISADALLFNDLNIKNELYDTVGEPAQSYHVDNCQLCKEKDRTIYALEQLNDLLKDKINSMHTKTA